MIDYLFNFKEIRWLLAWESLALMGLCLILLWGSKVCVSWGHRKLRIDHHLLEEDNPAIAVTVAGYFMAVGIILYHIISSPTHQGWGNLIVSYEEYWTEYVFPVIDVIYWFLLGTILLFFAGEINDRFLLPKFKNIKEIVEDRNVGAGASIAGSYIASSFMISVIIAYGNKEGDEGSILLETGLIVFYYIILQLSLVIFSRIYTRLLPYDFHHTLENDNPAPGIGFGFSLVAMGMILSYPLMATGNLWVLLFWFINGVALLLLTRWILNYVLFRQADLNREISEDRNWGVALIEGVSLIVIALIIKSSF